MSDAARKHAEEDSTTQEAKGRLYAASQALVTFALASAVEWADYEPWRRYGKDVMHRAMLQDHCTHVRRTALHFGGAPGLEKVPAGGGRGEPSSSLPSSADEDGPEASEEEEAEQRTPAPPTSAGKRKRGKGSRRRS